MSITDFHTELSIPGFMEYVEAIRTSENTTLVNAYRLAEAEHYKLFGFYKYSSYESFKVNRYKHYKKRLPNGYQKKEV
jgi:hypothetical protein